MGKFKVTYVDSIVHEIIVEAETREDASYKLPAWKPGDGSRHIKSIEPFIEEYEITYEHGDRHERRTDTILDNLILKNNRYEISVKWKNKNSSYIMNIYRNKDNIL